jgi:uncharacterized protein (DUF4415 family)
MVGSLALEKRHRMKGRPMKKDISSLTAAQKSELKALEQLPEANILTRDMPEQRDWSDAQRGVFYRPIKKQLTLRLDADLIEWFKTRASDTGGYQTNINKALREYVQSHRDR